MHIRKSYRDAILAEVTAAKAITDAVIREDREMTDVERDTVNGHLGKATKFQEDGEAEAKMAEQMADLSKSLGLGSPLDVPPEKLSGADHTPRQEKGRSTTIGNRFIESPEFKSLMAGASNGAFSEKMRVHSAPIAVQGMKDLFYSGNRNESAGFLVESDNRGMLDPFYERPLSIRNLFGTGNTQSDTIEYVRLVTVDNNASVVPEARTTGAIGTGTPAITATQAGLKPESTFGFQRDQTVIRTIAHWIPVTKRALSDAAQIRTMIDNFLRYGLEEALEDELLTGNGTGEHLLGLANTPGIQTQAAPGAGQDNMDVLAIARRKVAIGGRAQPTAYAMNPIDWEGIELMRNANGDFYGQGPFALTAPRIWGLPVVRSEAVPAGTAWCAAWNWGVVYDREQATVQATDTHADFFVRNLVAILAELRVGFAITRPPAFCRITLAV